MVTKQLPDYERQLIEVAVRWREARYAVEDALLFQELKHAIDMVIKERRGKPSDALKT